MEQEQRPQTAKQAGLAVSLAIQAHAMLKRRGIEIPVFGGVLAFMTVTEYEAITKRFKEVFFKNDTKVI